MKILKYVFGCLLALSLAFSAVIPGLAAAKNEVEIGTSISLVTEEHWDVEFETVLSENEEILEFDDEEFDEPDDVGEDDDGTAAEAEGSSSKRKKKIVAKGSLTNRAVVEIVIICLAVFVIGPLLIGGIPLIILLSVLRKVRRRR